MEIRFHGHACFELVEGETRLLIDPFLRPNNPAAQASADEVEPTHIALSHGHADHLADAVAVARRTGAHCVAIVELVNWLENEGVENTSDPNLASTAPGSEEAPYSAVHGVSLGHAAGLIVKIGGTTIYHTGDTCLFGDMRLIAERDPVDVVLMPIGGHYTMDRHDAAVAAGLIGAPTVIPMHYDTFGPIETDSEAFKAEVEAGTSSKVVLLKPGETHTA
jgi:L-ascorbate metabolism protein UlaG (beta-lactamase superfamily)